MKVKSFRLKLIFSFTIVILVPLALIAFFLDKSLEENSLRNIQSALITQARLIESQLSSEKITKEDFAYLNLFVKDPALKTKFRITVIDTTGKVLADSEKSTEDVFKMENHKDRPEIKTALAGGIGVDIHYSPTLKIDMLYAALPVKNEDRIIGVLRLALTLESVQNTLFIIRKIVFLGLFFALCFAFVLGSILAVKIITPIDKMVEDMKKLETVRRDFVANVSHELKTPLTSIKGFVETLLEGALDDKENNRAFLKIVQDHAGRLDTLVNDLLILSNLESDKIKLEKEGTDLKSKLDKVAGAFKAQLEKKGISFRNDLPPDLIVKADTHRIEQVFTNLIDNAIKFNKGKGSIKVYGEDSDSGIKVVVEDSGIGIPPKDIPRIFERFYRVDKARSRELGGTGLGLSIVKHIVELHGGIVGVESTEGLGSKFWFTLPK